MLKEGVIDKEKYQTTLYHHKNNDVSIEDALIETGTIQEEALLKLLAHMYKTRFVATDKLKRADIPQEVIDKIPAKVAMKHNVFPILYDPKNGELAIVARDPSDLMVEQQVSQAAGIPRVKSFVARPKAIGAAIAKFYRGDIHAFARLDREGIRAYHDMMDVYERNLLDDESMVTSLASEETQKREQMFSMDQMKQKAAQAEKEGVSRIGSELETILQVVRIFISLLESSRGDLAGHSVQTASLLKQMANRIGLSPRDTSALEMAGLLHDLGKGSPYHLTPLNVSEWEGHRTTAVKRFENPSQLFSSVSLPETTTDALRYMYETYDGTGLPSGLKGKDIPLGARILAMADTFSDLTSNPRNPYRRILSTEEAMKVLNKSKEKVFDPNLVDLFGIVVAGDDLKRQLLTGAQTVLLVDPDPEQTAILDLQLTSRGFKVRTAHSMETALKVVGQGIPNIIVSEVNLQDSDGFTLKKSLNKNEKTQSVPFLFFTTHAASSDVEKGFALGAVDYLVKPSAMEIVVAKIHKYLEDRPSGDSGGVSGSLSEMSLPDLVQILAHGRKSGQLKLRFGQKKGEIHFLNGEIYNALFEKLRGEEAFFNMLHYKDGTFSINPHFKAESKVIQMNSEMLLLEGLRRFDEENR